MSHLSLPKSWKNHPPPAKTEPLGIEAVFSDADADSLTRGFAPKQMEDKWFIYYADGWLRFHRSWTGLHVYSIRLERRPDGVKVVDSWVNRDPTQYGVTDIEFDRQLVWFLVEALLLGRDVAFPLPPGQEGLFQHHLVGRTPQE